MDDNRDMERDHPDSSSQSPCSSFNPRTQVGCHRSHGCFKPTRPHGTRHAPGRMAETQFKFQSTRPHGTRLQTLEKLPFHACFNPRVRMGRDAARVSCFDAIPSFNPRVRMGRDLVLTRRPWSFAMFQSTRPHGTRPAAGLWSSSARLVSTYFPQLNPFYLVQNEDSCWFSAD